MPVLTTAMGGHATTGKSVTAANGDLSAEFKPDPQKAAQPQLDFCSAQSHVSGNYFSLAALADLQDLTVRGLDIPYNFTISICRPLNRTYYIDDVSETQSVSAMYTDERGDHSLGQLSTNPYLRGRSLLLHYENGSPCLDDTGTPTAFRKSSIFSFKCDRDLPYDHPAAVSFVASPNNCSYFFDVRTSYACPSRNAKESVHPFTLFLVITLVAFAVYTAGSCVLRPASLLNLFSSFRNGFQRRFTHSGSNRDDTYARLYSKSDAYEA